MKKSLIIAGTAALFAVGSYYFAQDCEQSLKDHGYYSPPVSTVQSLRSELIETKDRISSMKWYIRVIGERELKLQYRYNLNRGPTVFLYSPEVCQAMMHYREQLTSKKDSLEVLIRETESQTAYRDVWEKTRRAREGYGYGIIGASLLFIVAGVSFFSWLSDRFYKKKE